MKLLDLKIDEKLTELLKLQKEGKITSLSQNIKYTLIPNRTWCEKRTRACHFMADFSYLSDDTRFVLKFIDYETEAYKIKRNLFLEKYVLKCKLSLIEIGENTTVYKKDRIILKKC